MTILIPPVEIGAIVDLTTFESIYINYETNSISGMFEEQEIIIYDFSNVGIKLSPSIYQYKVTNSAMGLIIQTKLK